MDKVCLFLNRRKQVHAYIPKMEKYIASKETMILQVMFPGYVFVETTLDQLEFNAFLSSMDEEKDGIIRELRKEEVSALTDDEKDLLRKLLNEKGILVMSEGYKENGVTIVTDGPLKEFQQDIVAVNKKDRLAILRIQFLNRKIKAGLIVR